MVHVGVHSIDMSIIRLGCLLQTWSKVRHHRVGVAWLVEF